MAKVIKKTADKTKKLHKAEVDRIVTQFNNRLVFHKQGWVGKTPAGFADKWVELYASDYNDEPLKEAIEQIKEAGYYVWKIYGCYGRNSALDTVYRITESRPFQSAVAEMLVKAAVRAAKKYDLKDIALAGGVGANGEIRRVLTEACAKRDLRAHFPTKETCTDNAAMIAMEAYLQVRYGDGSALAGEELDARASIPLV